MPGIPLRLPSASTLQGLIENGEPWRRSRWRRRSASRRIPARCSRRRRAARILPASAIAARRRRWRSCAAGTMRDRGRRLRRACRAGRPGRLSRGVMSRVQRRRSWSRAITMPAEEGPTLRDRSANSWLRPTAHAHAAAGQPGGLRVPSIGEFHLLRAAAQEGLACRRRCARIPLQLARRRSSSRPCGADVVARAAHARGQATRSARSVSCSPAVRSPLR